MKKPKYNILSPDGFPIDREKKYNSPEKAKEAFNEWKNRFQSQGYYSSNNGRIPHSELEEHCTLVEL